LLIGVYPARVIVDVGGDEPGTDHGQKDQESGPKTLKHQLAFSDQRSAPELMAEG
jgi:hypothetical protein